MPVKQSEKQGQHSSVLPFTRHEYPFPRNKAVVKNHIGIRGAWHEPSLEVLSRPEVMSGHYLLQPVPVSWNGKGHSVVLIFGAQCTGRNYQHLVGHGGLGDVHLASADHYAVLKPLFDTHISVRIGLLGGPQHPVALYVCLSVTSDQVFGLKTYQPFLEVLMVLGGAFVDLVRFV